MPTSPKRNVSVSVSRIVRGNRKISDKVADEMVRAEIAVAAFRARTDAGLTQSQLARRVGSTRSEIARLEDSDCGDDSLALLRRIAAGLDRRVELRLVPGRRPKHAM